MPWAGLRLAVTMLTAVPLPGGASGAGAPTRRTAAAALYWAPLVGLALGAAAAGILLLATRIGHAGALLGAALAITSLTVLTRALHLDGLADLADGLGSRKPADQALEIMKRSDVGPFGVVALLFTVLVQVSALARADDLGRGPVAVIAATTAARLAIALACRPGVPAARADGLGASVAGAASPLITVAMIAVALAGAVPLGLIFTIAIAVGIAVSVALTRLAVARLGGITGDVLGAIAEVTAAACLLVTAFS